MPSGAMYANIYSAITRIFVSGHANLGISAGAEDAINSFADLPAGWDYGSGGPIPRSTREIALLWNKVLNSFGFSDTEAFPGGDGEIAISGNFGPHHLEVIVESDHTISVAYDFQRKQVFYRLRKSTSEALNIVLELKEQIWSASTSFTLENTVQRTGGGPEQLSKITRAHYPFLGVNASQPPAPPFVRTPENITEEWKPSAANLRFFGSLTQTPSHLEAV
jgi:hypothetical protein